MAIQCVLPVEFSTLYLSDFESVASIFLVLNILVQHLCTFMSVYYALIYPKLIICNGVTLWLKLLFVCLFWRYVISSIVPLYNSFVSCFIK